MKLNDYNYAHWSSLIRESACPQNSGTVHGRCRSFSEVLQEMLFNQIVCYEKLGDWENAKNQRSQSYIQVYPGRCRCPERSKISGDQIKNTREEEGYAWTAEKILRSASFYFRG
ncbi:hypothetical protein [Mediterraneibacter gnavus]|uniref:hypothetical protein n=1 Tax=Mediterraneibacter gnavus TaxID=33038 RepID=UPI0004BA9D84|nr:hypothetical protein [Mediterraneibacter gnavus]